MVCFSCGCFTEIIGFSFFHKYALSTLDNQIFMATVIQYSILSNVPFIGRNTFIVSSTNKEKLLASTP